MITISFAFACLLGGWYVLNVKTIFSETDKHQKLKTLLTRFLKGLGGVLAVFCLAIYCITERGCGYNNAQQAAIRFTGVSFKDTLQLDVLNPKQSSLSNQRDGDIALIKDSGNTATLSYSNFYTPLLAMAGESYKLLNPAFNQPVTNSLIITALQGDTLLQLLKKGDDSFHIITKSSNVAFTKTGVYEIGDLVRGSDSFANNCRAVLGNTKLILGYSGANIGVQPQLFPGKSFASNLDKYNVFIDGRICPYQPTQHTASVAITAGTEFFVWHSTKSAYNRYRFDSSGGNRLMLNYTFPRFFPVKFGKVGEVVPLLLTNIADTAYNSKITNVVAPEMRNLKGDGYGFAFNSFYTVKNGGEKLTLNGFENDEIDIPANNNNVFYHAKLFNFKQSNHFSFFWHIFLPVVIFWLLCWLMLSAYFKVERRLPGKISKWAFNKQWQPDTSFFNPLLPLILLVAGVAMLFRWLLMWRIASFPPLDTQKTDFENLTNHFAWGSNFGGSVYFNYLILISFFALVWYRVRLMYRANNNTTGWFAKLVGKFRQFTDNRRSFLRVMAGAISGSTILYLALILVLRNSGEGSWAGGLFRIVVITAPILLATALKRLEVEYAKKQEVFGLTTSWFNGMRFFVISAIILGFFLAKEHSFLLVFFTAWFIWQLLFSNYMENQLALKILGVLAIACFAFLPLLERWGLAAKILLLADPSKQTACRIALLAEDKDSLFNQAKYTEDWGTFKKLVETAQNQSLINNYFQQGPPGGVSWGLTVQPHFDFAKAYTTQSNDLMCLRYIVSEYGLITIILLVLLFLLPVICRVLLLKQRKLNEDKLLGRDLVLNRDLFPLILFSVLSLLVVFSNVNWFVFMGLDLPFVNFQSKNSLITGFVLMACVLYNYNPRFEEFSYIFHYTDRRGFLNSPAFRNFVLLLSFVCLFSLSFWVCNKFVYKNKAAENIYSNKALTTALDAELQPLNDLMVRGQKDFINARKGAEQPDETLLCLMQNIADTFENTHTLLPHIKLLVSRLRLYTAKGRNWDVREDPLLSLEIKSGTDRANDKTFTYFSAGIKNAFETFFPFYKNNTYTGNVYSSDSFAQKDKVLAKFIWKNGRNLHVYPMKDTLPVIYSLVQNLKNKAETGDKENDSSMVLALDLQLARNIDSAVKNEMAKVTDNIGRYSTLLNFSQLGYEDMLNADNGTGWVWQPENAVLLQPDEKAKTVAAPADIITPALKKEFVRLYKQGSPRKQYGLILQAIGSFLDSTVKSVIVTAVDNFGRVRCAYYYNKAYQFDPNQVDNINANAELVKKTSNLEFAVNNTFFTNPCLQKLTIGPGSSIKPIMYNAILSQYNLGWDQLKVANNFEHGQFDNNGRIIKYADMDVKSNWHDSLFLELNYNRDAQIDNKIYLSGSSNLYHSAMLLLGYYKKEELRSFSKFSSNVKVDEDMPFFTKANGSSFGVKKDQWPTIKTINDCILAQGLKSNFSCSLFPFEKDSAHQINPDITGQNFIFDLAYSKGMHPLDFFKTYIQTATSGGNPISVSPLMMAVLNARMYTQNVSVEPGWFLSDSSAFAHFSFDSASYNSRESEYLDMVRKCIFTPLGDDIFRLPKDAGPDAYTHTLKDFTNQLRGLILGSTGMGNQVIMADRDTVFVFAKTGTSNITVSGKIRPSDRLLAGVLSKRNLLKPENANSFASLHDNKLLAFFIYGEALGGKSVGGDVTNNLRKKILALMAQSDSFKTLMQ